MKDCKKQRKQQKSSDLPLNLNIFLKEYSGFWKICRFFSSCTAFITKHYFNSTMVSIIIKHNNLDLDDDIIINKIDFFFLKNKFSLLSFSFCFLFLLFITSSITSINITHTQVISRVNLWRQSMNEWMREITLESFSLCLFVSKCLFLCFWQLKTS